MSHRIGSYVFGTAVGLLAAWVSYQWITDTARLEERRQQEQAVLAARAQLIDRLNLDAPEIVDPLAPQRRVGKAWVYPLESGWEVSGYYRRDEDDDWHDFLVTLDAERVATTIKVQDDDDALHSHAAADPAIEIVP